MIEDLRIRFMTEDLRIRFEKSKSNGRRTLITIISDQVVIAEFAIFPSQYSSRVQDTIARVVEEVVAEFVAKAREFILDVK